MKRKKIQFKIMLISVLALSMNGYAQKDIVRSDCAPVEDLTGTFDEATKTVYLEWSAPSKKMVRIKPIQEEIVEEQTSLPTDLTFYSFNVNNENILNNNPEDRADDWMMWCGPYFSALGFSCYCDMIVVARFTPTDLEAFGVLAGDKITKVRFALGSDSNPYTLHIYEGGTSPTNPGVLKYQQEIENVIEYEYNEVKLNTPFVIDVSKELWIGYRGVTYSYFAGFDAGPGVVGKGDIFYMADNDKWFTLYSLQMDANWNIDAYITTPDTGYTYHIYRDNTLIASDLENTNYTDDVAALSGENYEYCVVAVLLDCESDPVCKMVEKTVKIDENKKAGIDEQIVIFPNPTTGELGIRNYELRIESVEVFDVYGRKHECTNARKHEGGILMDISHLPAGIYFVKINTEKGIITKKIIKY